MESLQGPRQASATARRHGISPLCCSPGAGRSAPAGCCEQSGARLRAGGGRSRGEDQHQRDCGPDGDCARRSAGHRRWRPGRSPACSTCWSADDPPIRRGSGSPPATPTCAGVERPRAAGAGGPRAQSPRGRSVRLPAAVAAISSRCSGTMGSACRCSPSGSSGAASLAVAADGAVAITPAQLGYLLEGIDWRHPQRDRAPGAAAVNQFAMAIQTGRSGISPGGMTPPMLCR